MKRWAALALLLAACGDGDQLPPPYDLYLCDAMPEMDKQAFRVAVWDWNAAAGRVVLRWYDGDIAGRLGVDACIAERLDPRAGDCAIGTTEHGSEPGPGNAIRYLPGEAWDAAAHEAGHALGIEHQRSGLMSEWFVDGEITDADVAALRRRWPGLLHHD